MEQNFSGKSVIVTGGNSGIGLAAAIEFAQRGAYVLITGRRPDALSEAAKHHENIQTIVADVSHEEDAERVVKAALAATGKLDVLVNNAGIYGGGGIETVNAETVRSLFAINVVGLSFMTTAAVPYLKQTKGSIINIGSVVGHIAAPGTSHYGATKAAVESLTRSWAMELAPDGVRVNAVAPGPVETPIFSKTGMDAATVEGIKQQIVSSVPLGRIGQPEEIAHWIVALADPASTWMTGQILGVDGGMSLK